jgi:enamine deaminase RidA (YjgF/YER057c/UK114 family)
MSVYDKLELLGLTLPRATSAAGAYTAVAQVGNIAYVSGHIAKIDGKPHVGKLGDQLTTAEGREAARQVALDMIGTLHVALGDLNLIKHVAKMMVLVNSTESFTEQHLIANGASELLTEVLGVAGQHARSAFGVAQLPFGACVEIEMIIDVYERR